MKPDRRYGGGVEPRCGLHQSAPESLEDLFEPYLPAHEESPYMATFLRAKSLLGPFWCGA
eukprot:scaffold133083_cov42-Phaeocystis_antarctica.AAC.1